MKKRFASLSRLLGRVSRRLRLRFDSKRRRYVFEQRIYGGGWETVLVIQGARKQFQYPSRIHIKKLIDNDTSKWKSYGKLNKLALSRYDEWLKEGSVLQEQASKRKIHELVEGEFLPRAQWMASKMKHTRSDLRQIRHILAGKDTWWMRNREWEKHLGPKGEEHFYESS